MEKTACVRSDVVTKPAQQEGSKPTLKIKKVLIRKKGINGGITGGGYQCC